MKENRHQHTLEVMCAALQVTRKGYHTWNNRCESERDRHHAILNKHIEQIFKKSKSDINSLPMLPYSMLCLKVESRQSQYYAGKHYTASL
jgi:hypothetical protein